ncbi:hypothetical protein BJ508DRAFT_31444 [Ascobolus immersus RN42]|uniref:Uncharacterized protein n=1 Tax=Ascobolus immersus RN42 TaxID=1160509 RepID=A0A3N4IEF6_ASCIM|nr:hypothetical protein BJ508DRAFT_31444 [Ascobolus immersus RN42]
MQKNCNNVLLPNSTSPESGINEDAEMRDTARTHLASPTSSSADKGATTSVYGSNPFGFDEQLLQDFFASHGEVVNCVLTGVFDEPVDIAIPEFLWRRYLENRKDATDSAHPGASVRRWCRLPYEEAQMLGKRQPELYQETDEEVCVELVGVLPQFQWIVFKVRREMWERGLVGQEGGYDPYWQGETLRCKALVLTQK